MLIECLERIGVDGKDARIIANLYWQQKAAIKVEDELSPYIAIQRGVRHGCVLSPYLFNIYTEFIFREVEELEGININGKIINNMARLGTLKRLPTYSTYTRSSFSEKLKN